MRSSSDATGGLEVGLATSTSPLPSRREMERAFLAGDERYDGIFFTGVRTTGIFCRPSCPARKPLPGNVEFFATVREALTAGYRPCRRCHPARPIGETPAWVQRLLDEAEANPAQRLRDRDVRGLGIEPARARRYFLQHYGMTFQAYCRSRRLAGAVAHLRNGTPLDEVALASGWESHSGFREAFARLFGTPPGRIADASFVAMTAIDTPLGPMIAGAIDEGLCFLEFADRRLLEAQVARLQRLLQRPAVPGDHPHLERLRDELQRYFAETLRTFTVPLVFRGTTFEERVWRELLRVPYAGTCSYAALANRVGAPGAHRAVGRANGMNRIAILIPCHRVVNSNGQLGGYGGGLWRKHWLLALERRGDALLASCGRQPVFSGLASRSPSSSPPDQDVPPDP
jgi:AraC family transcriptional regulator, regulatory protein of adaptative response / methylated-DNA-[protein]-cysteine methyltransferase